MESLARIELAGIHRVLGEPDAAARELEHAELLAEETGSISARALIAAAKGDRLLDAGDVESAEASYVAAADAFAEAGMSARLAWALNFVSDARRRRGDLAGAEEALRAALRAVVPVGERGYRVESERRLAELLVERGRLDEAERMAIAARRTVGAHDVWSQASSAYALALVRERQGRVEEAEILLRGALDVLEPTSVGGGRLEQQIRELLEAAAAVTAAE